MDRGLKKSLGVFLMLATPIFCGLYCCQQSIIFKHTNHRSLIFLLPHLSVRNRVAKIIDSGQTQAVNRAVNIADFIIIGGGIAGASAGYELRQKGRVIILEKEA
ncbi:MAG: FAD-dependent oxidoreductase, partial [Emcibacter sp.]|nr:FAD-dependent oxidoreductase [Emcibacter sp.]